MPTREYSGPHDTRRLALRQAVATCRAEAAESAVSYPILASRYVGKKPKFWDTDPERYATIMLSRPEKNRRTGKFWLRVSRRMKRIKMARLMVDDEEVDIAREGVELDMADFEVPDDE